MLTFVKRLYCQCYDSFKAISEFFYVIDLRLDSFIRSVSCDSVKQKSFVCPKGPVTMQSIAKFWNGFGSNGPYGNVCVQAPECLGAHPGKSFSSGNILISQITFYMICLCKPLTYIQGIKEIRARLREGFSIRSCAVQRVSVLQ